MSSIPLVVSVPSASCPSVPSGLKSGASVGPNDGNLSPNTPVVQYGGYTYWAHSYIDNRVSFNIVAYDAAGKVVKQWEKPGARYIYKITVDSAAQTITFWGQSDQKVVMSWNELVTPVDAPTPQPTQFQCILTLKGNVSKIDGTMSNATLDAQGPGGRTSVHINGSDNSFVSFGTQIGQFGTNDFTVAFWVQTAETYRYFDLAGNRAAGSHGNFFCIRMTGKHESRPAGLIGSEVDQDQNGTNYIGVESKTAGFNDGKWHHIAAVRKGTSLKLYIDGVVSGNGSGQGVANIANGNAFKLGRSLVGVHDKFAADARYSDLRVYDTALNDSEISSLFSSVTALKLLTNSKIKLKSWKGDYLHRPDTEQGVTSWNTGVGNEWIVESIGDNKIKLKSWKGDYLHRPDSAQGVTTWSTGVGNEWIVESIGDNKIKLKSWKGDYLHRPDSAQGVTSWSTGVGNEWMVEVITAEVPKVPPSFDVPGDSPNGYEFINTQNSATSYTFTASGTWSPDKNNPNLQGCTAEGLPSFNSYVQDGIKQAWPSIQENMKYPKTPFSLIAENTKTGEVIQVGKKATIVLKPGENLRFVLNDAVWNYDNNSGSLKVDWVIGS
ncbi:MAG: hypothetical protein RLZZ338_1370 [Cyanobacteriota bacterium]|jgi:hypothetical protein